MDKIFDEVTIDGIVKPGQIYITSPYDRGFPPKEASAIYAITSDEEALIALDIDLRYRCGNDDEPICYLGMEVVSEDSYLFKIKCKEKEGGDESVVYLYLHRLMTVKEEQVNAEKLL